MDLDERDEDEIVEEEEEEEDGVMEPSSPLTYPNTVPFLHGPRMSISPRPIELGVEERGPISSSSRRTVSFSDRERDPPLSAVRVTRQSFSIPRPGLPPIEYVTSRNLSRSTSIDYPMDAESDPRVRRKTPLKRPTSWAEHADEPRLLISNNDLSIKMFSLRPTSPTAQVSGQAPVPVPVPVSSAQYQYRPLATFGNVWTSHMPSPIPVPNPDRADSGGDEPVYRHPLYLQSQDQTQMLEGDTVWMRAGDGQAIHRGPERISLRRSTGGAAPRSRPAPPAPAPGPVMNGEERKLVRLGMTQFKCAINHCVFSPTPSPRLTNSIPIPRSEEYGLRR
jgi:hypothetical protein